MGDRRHHASEDGEALFRLLQVQAGFYIFILGSDYYLRLGKAENLPRYQTIKNSCMYRV